MEINMKYIVPACILIVAGAGYLWFCYTIYGVKPVGQTFIGTSMIHIAIRMLTKRSF